MSDSFEMKLRLAKGRIVEAHREIGINRLYVAYSGGDDSKAVLALTRSLYPGAMAIHSGEDVKTKDFPIVLCIKPPKTVNVPYFLRCVDLVAQIDGTRKDEDKTVIFDGYTTDRKDMPAYRTDRGVWDLKVWYPIWDWTEQDVSNYLRSQGINPCR